jgi:hypothetical protein
MKRQAGFKIRATPLKTVNDKFGSKEALAKELIKRLDRPEGETDDSFLKRLKAQRNSKLLTIYHRTEELKQKFGGSKEKLAEAVLESSGHKKAKTDEDFKKKLMSLNVGRLLDMLNAAPRRA